MADLGEEGAIGGEEVGLLIIGKPAPLEGRKFCAGFEAGNCGRHEARESGDDWSHVKGMNPVQHFVFKRDLVGVPTFG